MVAPPRRQKSADAVAGLEHRQRDRRTARRRSREACPSMHCCFSTGVRKRNMSEANSARSCLVLCVAGSAHPAGGSLCCRPCAPVATSLPRTGSSGPCRKDSRSCRAGPLPRWPEPPVRRVGSARCRRSSVRTEAEPGRAKRRNDGRLTSLRTGPAVGRPGAGIAASRILPPHREQHGVAPRSARSAVGIPASPGQHSAAAAAFAIGAKNWLEIIALQSLRNP